MAAARGGSHGGARRDGCGAWRLAWPRLGGWHQAGVVRVGLPSVLVRVRPCSSVPSARRPPPPAVAGFAGYCGLRRSRWRRMFGFSVCHADSPSSGDPPFHASPTAQAARPPRSDAGFAWLEPLHACGAPDGADVRAGGIQPDRCLLARQAQPPGPDRAGGEHALHLHRFRPRQRVRQWRRRSGGPVHRGGTARRGRPRRWPDAFAPPGFQPGVGRRDPAVYPAVARARPGPGQRGRSGQYLSALLHAGHALRRLHRGLRLYPARAGRHPHGGLYQRSPACSIWFWTPF